MKSCLTAIFGISALLLSAEAQAGWRALELTCDNAFSPQNLSLKGDDEPGDPQVYDRIDGCNNGNVTKVSGPPDAKTNFRLKSVLKPDDVGRKVLFKHTGSIKREDFTYGVAHITEAIYSFSVPPGAAALESRRVRLKTSDKTNQDPSSIVGFDAERTIQIASPDFLTFIDASAVVGEQIYDLPVGEYLIFVSYVSEYRGIVADPSTGRRKGLTRKLKVGLAIEE